MSIRDDFFAKKAKGSLWYVANASAASGTATLNITNA